MELQVGGFDLIYKGEPIKSPIYPTVQTMLGGSNNRV